MSNAERLIARAMLLSAGYKTDAEWMAASCPHLNYVRWIINEDRKRGRL